MELPRNITQIGESDRHCKIYIEDYVISYMKQLNRVAQDKDMAVALYGVQKEENGVSYLFLYGACKLTFLQRETRHLSQAQQQEVEKLRVKYFNEYTFLGYRLLNGEMIEGMHISEQGICRYISGYAQFYEKNDSMLAYMLDVREETKPEVVEQEKYEIVKKRQEERRVQHEENRYSKATPPKAKSSGSLKGMRVAVVSVFALLCLIGLTSMNGQGKLEDLQAVARQVIDSASSQQIPDADTLIAEDKLAEAILQENEMVLATTPQDVEQVSAQGVVPVETESVEEEVIATEPEMLEEPISATEVEYVEESVSATDSTIVEEPVVVPETIEEAEPTSYVIQEGDTLIGICMWNYGTDANVAEVCSYNQIDNPDDIKVGQKILLP